MHSIEISRMAESDLDCVLEIAFEGNLCRWSAEDYKIEIQKSDSVLLVARQNHLILGFIATRITNPEKDTNSSNAENSEADILNIAVENKYQNKGVGTLLLRKTLSDANERRVKTVWLEVRESNSKAIKFYQREGFAEIQKRKNFYTAPMENALVMMLKLEKYKWNRAQIKT